MGKRQGSKPDDQGAGAFESRPFPGQTPTSPDAPAPQSSPTLAWAIRKLRQVVTTIDRGKYEDKTDLAALDIKRKACGDLIKAIGVRDELDHLRELAAQLEEDRAERAALELGVQFTDEAPQLPNQGSGEPH